jgi:membrane protein DedA with SNARE-associated domain
VKVSSSNDAYIRLLQVSLLILFGIALKSISCFYFGDVLKEKILWNIWEGRFVNNLMNLMDANIDFHGWTTGCVVNFFEFKFNEI